MIRQVKVYKDGIHYIGIPHKESKARGRRPRHEDLVEVIEPTEEEKKLQRRQAEKIRLPFRTWYPCPREGGKKKRKKAKL